MKEKDTRPFAQRHPKLNFLIGLLILLGALTGVVYILRCIINFFGNAIPRFIDWLASLASGLDAVVIVALITGSVSIVGVIISSVVAKLIDYRKSRQDYLAKKREEPYGDFVDMIYKVHQNAKKPQSYTEEQMIDDLNQFSKSITLWGSPCVVKRWVKFREQGANPELALKNVFLMEEIMNEMRRDLGQKRVKKGELLAFFVNDIKQVMKGKNK